MFNALILLGLPIIFTIPLYKKRNIVKASFSLLAVLIFIISLSQAFLGRGKDTIVYGICHFSTKRVWVYGILETVGLVGLFQILKKILKEGLDYFMDIFDAVLSMCLVFMFIFGKEASNWVYILIFIISLTISILVYCWLPEKIRFVSFTNNRLQFFSSILVGVFFAISTLFFIPNEIVMSNYNDMQMSMHIYVIISIIITLITALLFSVFLLNLSPHCNWFMSVFVFAFLIAGYIQSNFLNGKMSILAGDMQNWTFQVKRSNAMIYITIFLVVAGALFLLKESLARKIVLTISIYLSLIMISTVIYLGVTVEKTEKVYLDNSEIMEVGATDNVIVFVLDRFDTQILDKILREDSTVDDFLGDFTYYPDIVSPYCYTSCAIPYLLTGWNMEYTSDESRYNAIAFSNSTLLEDIYNQGYTIDIYSSEKPNKVVSDYIRNMKQSIDYTIDWNDSISVLYATARYSMMPFALKEFFSYDTEDFRNVVDSSDYNYNNINFMRNVLNEGITIDDSINKSFKFYHVSGTHSPYSIDDTLSENLTNWGMSYSGIGCLKVVNEYIQQMKELDIYDDATIIITADHGHFWTRSGSRYMADNFGASYCSVPICFVKKANSHGDGEYQVADYPVTFAELVQTMSESFGLDKKYASDYDLETAINKPKEVRYELFNVTWELFSIDGVASNPDSWELVGTVE